MKSRVVRLAILIGITVILSANGTQSQASAYQNGSVDNTTYILREYFEGGWPQKSSLWTVKNVNDKDGQRWVEGLVPQPQYFSGTSIPGAPRTAHVPGFTQPYKPHLNTYMQYGPFAIPGGPNLQWARMDFWYLLDTEKSYDFFTWEASCDGGKTWVNRNSRSGQSAGWELGYLGLFRCGGYNSVLVRFTLTSDGSVSGRGVWVDAVQIRYLYQ